ncbi:MAG TPA: hypothetical protein VL993_05640 [Stellaceae bacterium]|nr:hypothetical protein [Stellaceae bacterium]
MRRSWRVAALAMIGLAMLAVPGRAQTLLDPRHHLPAASFAYVGDAGNPGTWKLPYRRADGSVDGRRLPLAIEAMLGAYRGRRARIPDAARHDVLERLAQAADEIGRMPPRAAHPRPLYQELAAALAQ